MAKTDVTTLDLTNNLFSTWSSIADVARELPLLSTLDISGNRLSSLSLHPFPKFDDNDSGAFGALQELILDRTRIPWHDVLHVASRMPKLGVLRFGGNCAAADWIANRNEDSEATASPPSILLPTLHTLALPLNELRSWPDLMRNLSSFSSLERLNISSNPLLSVEEMVAADAAPALAHWTHVNISRNEQMRTWRSLEALDDWMRASQRCGGTGDSSTTEGPAGSAKGGLQSVMIDWPVPPTDEDRIKSAALGSTAALNPEQEEAEMRRLITSPSMTMLRSSSDVQLILLARLPSLQTINSSAVRVDQRRDAELYFLQRLVELFPDDVQARQNLWRRYDEMIKTYGLPEKVQSAAAQAKVSAKATLQSKLIRLDVIFLKTSLGGGQRDEVLQALLQQQEGVDAPRTQASVQLLPTTPLQMVRTKLARIYASKTGVKLKPSNLELHALLRRPDGVDGDGATNDASTITDGAEGETALSMDALAELVKTCPLVSLAAGDAGTGAASASLERAGVSHGDCILAHVGAD